MKPHRVEDRRPAIVKCPMCEGSGTIAFTVRSYPETDETHGAMGCYVCEGKGTVTPERAADFRAMNAVWCTCGNPGGESTFYTDGQHATMHKHHYRCNDCGKVTQIG